MSRGLHLSATTIARMSTETEPSFDDALAAAPEIDTLTTRVVTAKYPGHTMHVDLTTIPTWSGFWVPWFPFSLPQSWPSIISRGPWSVLRFSWTDPLRLIFSASSTVRHELDLYVY